MRRKQCCYAEHIGAERATEEADVARKEGKTTAADEIRAAAARLGLELVPSSKSETGFKNVHKDGGKYVTQIKENGRNRILGRFSTPEEAAFCYAGHIGAEKSAEEVAEAALTTAKHQRDRSARAGTLRVVSTESGVPGRRDARCCRERARREAVKQPKSAAPVELGP